MTAQIGAYGGDLFGDPRPELLTDVARAQPEPGGEWVDLGPRGFRSTQRLRVGDLAGGVGVATWPAELQPQARYLYGRGLGSALVAAAIERGWTVEPSPHIAYYTSSPGRRLYMRPSMEPLDYAAFWEDEYALRRVGNHSREDVEHELWPWLKQSGFADDDDDSELRRFLDEFLGRRPAHMRPGLRFRRVWTVAEAAELGSALAETMRTEFDAVFAVAHEPRLSPVETVGLEARESGRAPSASAHSGGLVREAIPERVGVSSRGIFLSYRRADAAPYARLLQYQLRERLPHVRVFMDLDSIEAGLDFAEVIREAVDSSAVLVALIGPQWVNLANEQGRRRLDDPDDYVRFEVQAALERGVRVIPVLVDSARPLRQEELPAELRKLARLNAMELTYGRYEYDAGRLIDLIERVLAGASSAGIAPGFRSIVSGEASTASGDVSRNTPGRTQKDAGADRKDRARSTRMLIDAKRTAESITGKRPRSAALGDVAGALAATDADRAERIAQSLIDDDQKVGALVGIALNLAATDADRAERIAASVTSEGMKAIVLAGIAERLAATDADRAERIARAITDEGRKATALADVANALAVIDPDRTARLIADAERITASLTEGGTKAIVLARIAGAAAATDPDRAAWLIADAERIAESLTEEGTKSIVFSGIAENLAATDADRAERIARAITDEDEKVDALTGIVKVLAATEPDRAERIAQALTDEEQKASTLAGIAEKLAATDPERTARLIADAERIAQAITDEDGKPAALTAIVKALAATDPDRAERIAQAITNKNRKVEALVAIAKA